MIRPGGRWRALLLALLTGCTSAAAEPEASPAPLDAGTPDPLAGPRALFASRLDPKSLTSVLTQLDALNSPDAERLQLEALLFRVERSRARHGHGERTSIHADAARARVLALRQWEGEQPGASTNLAPAGLAAGLANAPAAAAAALIRLGEADWELAPELDTASGARLRHEALAVSERALELAPPREAPRAGRILATTLAALPRPAGGDFARARFQFEGDIAATPDDIADRVEEAARIAVEARDRGLFRALLRRALQIDPEEPAADAPERQLARVRALWLAHHERALFGR